MNDTSFVVSSSWGNLLACKRVKRSAAALPATCDDGMDQLSRGKGSVWVPHCSYASQPDAHTQHRVGARRQRLAGRGS
jgi:hypothetical protein